MLVVTWCDFLEEAGKYSIAPASTILLKILDPSAVIGNVVYCQIVTRYYNSGEYSISSVTQISMIRNDIN